jgi:hypothetical protein
MNVSPGWGTEWTPRSAVPVSPELRAYAHIEGLIGEEVALLAVPEADRTREQHERLHAVRTELDRIWERLRQRAERLAHPGAPGAARA